MNLRLMGTREECVRLTEALPGRLAGLAQVVEVSQFRPNRGSSVRGRVYVEVRLVAPGEVIPLAHLLAEGGLA